MGKQRRYTCRDAAGVIVGDLYSSIRPLVTDTAWIHDRRKRGQLVKFEIVDILPGDAFTVVESDC
jgi:hypothetical protein